MKLILFDIDGTLLWTDGAGRRAMNQAVRDALDAPPPFDGYRFDGKTDPQIIAELFALAGHTSVPDDRVAAVGERYVSLLGAELARAEQVTRVLPGVPELLDALMPYEAAGRVLVGLLTGNFQRGAAMKLRSAGIAPARFAVGAYGSDAARRVDLPPIATARAAALTGRSFGGADVVIVGDTPDDVACGRPFGAHAVAVATGSYDRAALAAAGAAVTLADLSETAAVLDALLAP